MFEMELSEKLGKPIHKISKISLMIPAVGMNHLTRIVLKY